MLLGNDCIVDGIVFSVINVGVGDDIVFGGDGNEIIIGSFGDDDLEGGGGNDIYVYNLGDGNDCIVEGYYGGFNMLVFGVGIDFGGLIFMCDVINGNNVCIIFVGYDGLILF